MKNLCSKTRPKNDPYEVWQSRNGEWTWNVLKKYKAEVTGPYDRWFCFVTSPFCPEGELGDVYCREIMSQASKIR
jgi:hypothetical protein